VSDDCSDEQREAVECWLRTRHGEQLGTIAGIERAPIEFTFDGDAYSLHVAERVSVEGLAMADRACCTMRENVWYEPLVDVAVPVVGNSSVCRFEGSEALESWAYQGQNQTFVADFNECCWAMKKQQECCSAPERSVLAAN
jgi:hypothetical protein